MSMSAQHGGSRRPSTVSTGSPGGPKKGPTKSATAKSSKAKSSSAKSGTAKPGGGRSPAGTARGPRPPIKPVKVTEGRNWGPIALFVVVGLLAAGIIGYGAWYAIIGGVSWADKAKAIPGVVDYRDDPEAVARGHVETSITYKISPPVGGEHNSAWQRCFGDVYDAPIANEHAVHSLEHGAIWITYRPDLPADQVEKLAARVRGNDYMLMSPYEGLDAPISLQAWGFQLKVDDADDKRIDEFITTLRDVAGPEEATCSFGNYVTATGTTPRDMGPDPHSGGLGG